MPQQSSDNELQQAQKYLAQALRSLETAIDERIAKAVAKATQERAVAAASVSVIEAKVAERLQQEIDRLLQVIKEKNETVQTLEKENAILKQENSHLRFTGEMTHQRIGALINDFSTALEEEGV